MNAPRQVPENVTREQLRASNPEVSAWVSANAGSGKTHVLTQRVISLLLKGEDPARILCITFTKAAAANMASRVFKTLAEWTILDDDALDLRIAEIGGKPDAASRARARRLFALALETPGGLKVQTIHAFCTRLLHQFPFEADVAARFTVLDEASEHQLLEKLMLEVMLEGAADGGSTLGQALSMAITRAADTNLREALRETVRGRKLSQWIDRAGSLDAAMAQLSQTMGLEPSDNLEALDGEFFSASLFSPAEWREAAGILTQGSQADQKTAAELIRLAQLSGAEYADALFPVFLTKDLQPRKKLVTKKIAETDPALAEKLLTEQQRVCALRDRKHALLCRDRSRALFTLADEITRRYRREKDRRGLLDYDDLIDKTLALFQKTSAAWVLFKLDLGVNHVLIDEAQDTSPKQWEIIETLIGEFTAGAGARPARRTMFAVGDDKQSIFSFQGADPNMFATKAKQFAKNFHDAELPFELVPLRTSFRSGEAVLGAVDIVFKRPEAHAGLSGDVTATVHEYLPGTPPGCVDIWPLTRSDPKQQPEGWDAPFDSRSETSPSVQLAQRIARHAALWIAQGRAPGDILVLVRQRGPLFETIIRALKTAQIPVAGADRLVLTQHIAVMDLMVLADALLLPEDDLALATILKSPLFGLTDDDLFGIAWDRGGKSLRAALAAERDEKFVHAARKLERLSEDAQRLSPFAFYARLLGPNHGRRQFLARLGHEANDALDEFLNLALAFETRETPSLQGFVSWLRAAEVEIKRDMEQGRNEVRVMTVHGAKGLEAPIVVLADTTTRPSGHHPPKLIPLAAGHSQALIWVGSKKTDPQTAIAARQNLTTANENEYRRLLYVAMTRAQDRLIVCGIARKPTKDDDAPKPSGCWYQLIEDALIRSEGECDEIDAEDGDGKIWRYRKSLAHPPAAAEPSGLTTAKNLPPWLLQNAAIAPMPLAPLSPSIAGEELAGEEDATARITASAERGKAILRGRLIHRLLQSLPDLVSERRRATAQNYLQRASPTLAADERDNILAQVFGILDDARFKALFAPGSRAEVPLIGRLARPGQPPLPVSGQVDRLVMTQDSVLIADYKTNHAPPRDLPEALAGYPGYVLQLALYRALLGAIRPELAVEAALIWTESANLMEIPGAALDAALLRFTSP